MNKVEDTFVDYAGENVLWMKVNGTEITSNPFANDRIQLKKENLKAGSNVVVIRFESRYARDCEGIHYYKDSADGEEYLYSMFAAAFAHKAFPCFD